MIIHSATYIKSSPSIKECPAPTMPEFGFIGRSNVGKSSLINMLTGWSKLAKTSVQPGKTRSINHFLVNDSWYLVDLPGYGYAKVPIRLREEWVKSTDHFILTRDSLVSLFVLLDSRHKPQASDLKFMESLGINQIPFARVFTKSDKLGVNSLSKSIDEYKLELLKYWETLPQIFVSSSVKVIGKEEILDYISELNKIIDAG